MTHDDREEAGEAAADIPIPAAPPRISEYEAQAREFLDRFGLTMEIASRSFEPPEWYEDGPIGNRYFVVIGRLGRRSGKTKRLGFLFWGSAADKDANRPPGAYDVLACVSGDIGTQEKFEDFCADMGYNADSRKAEATWKRCLMFSRKVHGFFDDEELAALGGIQ